MVNLLFQHNIYVSEQTKQLTNTYFKEMYFLIWVEHGNSYRSEVAFDDFLLRPRTCQKIPSAPPLPEHPKDTLRRLQAEKELESIKKNWKPLGTTTKKTPFTTRSPVKVLVPKFAQE